MAFKIDKTCIGCGACTAACAVNAIIPEDRKYKIDKELCINCGACVELCPVEAINEK